MIHRWQKSKQYETPTGEVYEVHDITDPDNFVLVDEIVDALAHPLGHRDFPSEASGKDRQKIIDWERHNGHTYLVVRRPGEHARTSLAVIHEAVAHRRLSAGLAQLTGIVDRLSIVEMGASNDLWDSGQQQIDDVTAVMKHAALNGIPPRALFHHPGTAGLNVLAARIGLTNERPWLNRAISIPYPQVEAPYGFERSSS